MRTNIGFTPSIKSNKKLVVALCAILFMYLIDNLPNTSFINNFTLTYIIRPMLWIGIAIYILKMPCMRPTSKLKHRKLIFDWSIIFGIMFIAINVFAGFFFGFGKSPYNRSPMGVLTNIIYIGSALLGREFIRHYLVNSLAKEEDYGIFIFISLILTLTSFNVNKYVQLTNFESIVQYLAETFAPKFTQNIFVTYLAFLGGPMPSIIYLGIIEGFYWFSPILPNLKWIVTALIGVLCPVFFLMTFQDIYVHVKRKIKYKEQKNEGSIGWIITSIISISIIWFTVGVFPIYPSVIATGSMKPMIKAGDVILVKKLLDMDKVYELQVGEVIQFKRNKILISHRIIDIIIDEKEGIKFKTKGDNNSAEDTDLVRPEDIKGTIEHTIPRIGWTTLFIKSNKDIDLDKIEF